MKLTTILKVIKPVTSLVAASATGLVVKNVITATTPADLGKYQTFMVKAGGFFVGGAVGGLVADHVERQFDIAIKAVESVTDPDIYTQGVSKKFDDFMETLTPAEQRKLALEIAESVKAAQKDEATEKEEA